jgi:hypothetical protein
MDGHELTYLQDLDDASWQQIARAALECDRAEVHTRRAEEIFVGIGAGTSVFRVTGTASAGHRGTLDWTVVVKVRTLNTLDYQSTSAEPSAWDYWKREWHAYRSAWLPRLDGPLVAPRCFGSGSVCSESGGELAWIAMEDLGSSQHRPWPIRSFRLFAHQVGVSNGRYLDAADQPADPWIARNWLRGWSEQAAPFITQLAEAGAHAVAGRIFTADLIDDLYRTWEQREKLHSALAALPHGSGSLGWPRCGGLIWPHPEGRHAAVAA